MTRRRRKPRRPATAAAVAVGVTVALCSCTGGHGATPQARPTPMTGSTGSPPAVATVDPRVTAQMATLSTKVWPDSPAGALATLARMPDLLGPSHLRSRTRTEANYGRPGEPTATLTVAPLKEAAGPSMSMTDFFDAFLRSGQFVVTSREPARPDELYAVGVLNDSPHLQVAAWARRDGHYLFGAEASGNELLIRLLGAFQKAASGR